MVCHLLPFAKVGQNTDKNFAHILQNSIKKIHMKYNSVFLSDFDLQ